MIPAKKIYTLNGAIVPQLFTMRDKVIYYFDKINRDEGKFYRYEDDVSYEIVEVEEGQGIILEDSKMYLLEIGDISVLSRYYENGTREKVLDLDGIFFDIKVNETGHFICLGNIDGETIIKIINNRGKEVGDIKPNIFFGSTIYVYNDYIYIGGFNENNRFVVMKINYIGGIEESFETNIENNNQIISKMTKEDDNIYLLFSGEEDNIIIIDEKTKGLKSLSPRTLGIKNFVDFNINNEKLLILEENKIYEWGLEEILNSRIKVRNSIQRRGFKPKEGYLSSYQFFLYILGIRDYFPYGVIGSLVMTSILFFYLSRNSLIDITTYRLLFLLANFFVVLSYLITSTINTISYVDKYKRIDRLLYINGNYNKINFRLYSLYVGLTGFCFISLLLFPNSNIIYSVLIFIIIVLFCNYLGNRTLRTMDLNNKSIMIELLNDSTQFKRYIKNSVEKIKQDNADRIVIEISSINTVDDSNIKKWVQSRSPVIKQDISFTVENNRIVTIIDLSKRDLKYSRYSVLMDFICYLNRDMEIKDVKIGYVDDKR